MLSAWKGRKYYLPCSSAATKTSNTAKVVITSKGVPIRTPFCFVSTFLGVFLLCVLRVSVFKYFSYFANRTESRIDVNVLS